MITLFNPIHRPNPPLAATIGFFDGVHRGHRHLLSCVARYAAQHGLESAAITFPLHPRKVLHQYYQPETLTGFDRKLEQLSTTGIDTCVVMDFTPAIAALTAMEFLTMLSRNYNVKVLFMGYDHKFGSDRIEHFERYDELGRNAGIEIIRADAFKLHHRQISSSFIRKLLLSGNIREATTALGRPYQLCGQVIHGFGIGRAELGFPTANLKLETPDQLLPRIGVYAVRAWVDNQCHNGMANIGLRPTVHLDGGMSIEINLFDFDADLYGKTLCADLIDYLRPEKKLCSKEELSRQLTLDKIQAKETLKRYVAQRV